MLLNFCKNIFLFWGQERTFYVFAEEEILDYIQQGYLSVDMKPNNSLKLAESFS